MIPLAPAPEPADFDERVRQPGLRAIAELAGEHPPRTTGRPHEPVAGSREEVPHGKFPPYWRGMLDDLMESYDRICAYLCLYIPRGTGAPSVDHAVPKSMRWDRVYEWSNYRLACALMNARKGAAAHVLDPFEVEDGWFALELVEFQVVPGEGLPGDVAASVVDAIERLRLNEPDCCDARAEYAQDFWDCQISLPYLARHAPFVERELRRQCRLGG